jgi:hypothetical protein
VTGRVRVDYASQNSTGQIEYELDVVNVGTTSLTPNQIELRYYIQRENTGTALTGTTVVNQLHNPFNAAGGGAVTTTLVAAGASDPGADHYVRVTFAGTTAVAQSQLIRIRTYFQPANQTQANDYSYATHASKIAWDRIVVLVNGVQEWGCAP